MKNLTIYLIAVLVVISFSCKKSDDDPQVENYTIEYSVESTSTLIMDTISYLDVNGNEQILTGELNLTHSFTVPSNNYHARLYVSGNTGDNGSSDYSVTVLDENSGVVTLKESGSSGTNINFSWEGEVSYSESK